MIIGGKSRQPAARLLNNVQEAIEILSKLN